MTITLMILVKSRMIGDTHDDDDVYDDDDDNDYLQR